MWVWHQKRNIRFIKKRLRPTISAKNLFDVESLTKPFPKSKNHFRNAKIVGPNLFLDAIPNYFDPVIIYHNGQASSEGKNRTMVESSIPPTMNRPGNDWSTIVNRNISMKHLKVDRISMILMSIIEIGIAKILNFLKKLIWQLPHFTIFKKSKSGHEHGKLSMDFGVVRKP